MTYKINGIEFSLKPTTAGWVGREKYGTSGQGNAMYPAVRNFQMTWELMPVEDFAQLQGFYESVSNTGTCVVELPQYGAVAYQFKEYSGCTLEEPTFDEYYEQHVTGVKFLILKIRG